MRIKNYIFGAATFFTLVILLEVLSFIALQIIEMNHPVISEINRKLYRRDGIDPKLLNSDMESIYKDLVILEPYRGYALPRNFEGYYVTTDNYGFRNDPNKQIHGQSKKIGLFGGSTMFGVTSNQKETISYLVDKRLKPELAQTFDFGVGAYSTSNELMTFAEVSRLKHYNIEYAVFFDGVNEIARYVESLQDSQSNPFYEVIGYPYVSSVLPAAKNFIRLKRWTSINYYPALVQILEKVASRINTSKNINFILTDANIDRHAENIYQIYVNNVLDINAIAKSRGIQPIFIWQPTLFTIKNRDFTDNEKQILAANKMVKRLSDALLARIQKSNELNGIKFFDLSGSFDKLSKYDHFFDFCHVGKDANLQISEDIVEVLKQFLPLNHFDENDFK